MTDEQVQLLFQDLFNDERYVLARAIRAIAPLGERLIPTLPRLFELTFDKSPAISSDAAAVIRRTGAAAVPFILEQSMSAKAVCRERAINFLMEAGGRRCWEVHLATQELGPRLESLPEWGDKAGDVWELFSKSISDNDLMVRFAAASALEEFGRLVERTIPVFIEALSIGTVFQRNWAALRLGRIGSTAKSARSALAALCEYSEEDRWTGYMILAARKALDRIGNG